MWKNNLSVISNSHKYQVTIIKYKCYIINSLKTKLVYKIINIYPLFYFYYIYIYQKTE